MGYFFAGVPDQPKDASVIADTPTKATFSVDPPANTGGEPIQGYTIRYDGQILNFRLGKFCTLMLLMANLANIKWCKKPWKSDWNPGTWVLIWEYYARAI